MIEAKIQDGHLVMVAKCEHGKGRAERHHSIPVGELAKRVTLDMEAELVTQLLREAGKALPDGATKTAIVELLTRLDKPAINTAQIEKSVNHWKARMEAEAEAEAKAQDTLRNCAALKDCWCDTVGEPGTADHNTGG